MAPSLAKAEDLGKIEVRIHRIHRTKRAFPLFSSTDISDKPIVEVSEKTLKGKAIANTVWYAASTIYNVCILGNISAVPPTTRLTLDHLPRPMTPHLLMEWGVTP